MNNSTNQLLTPEVMADIYNFMESGSLSIVCIQMEVRKVRCSNGVSTIKSIEVNGRTVRVFESVHCIVDVHL